MALTLQDMTPNDISLHLKSKFPDLQSHTFTFLAHLAMSKKPNQISATNPEAEPLFLLPI